MFRSFKYTLVPFVAFKSFKIVLRLDGFLMDNFVKYEFSSLDKKLNGLLPLIERKFYALYDVDVNAIYHLRDQNGRFVEDMAFDAFYICEDFNDFYSVASNVILNCRLNDI